jgi:hydroxymethylbilane synthase
MKAILHIGTRKSPLALWQAEYVKERLETLHPGLQCRLVRIVTQGDKILDVPLARVGGKGLFIKEIEQALLEGEIDLAVHSLKDMPAEIPRGLVLGAVPAREDPRDVLVAANPSLTLDTLPQEASIGTSSLRRMAQLHHFRRDLRVVPLRGNVGTRLQKVAGGAVDAVVLAYAGVMRLGEAHRISQIVDPEICLPAIGQGALGIEVREDDQRTRDLLHPLHDAGTAVAVSAERAFLARLQGGCQVPIGGLSGLDRGRLSLTGLVASLDGREYVKDTIQGSPEAAEELGRELAERVLGRGGGKILREIYGAAQN